MNTSLLPQSPKDITEFQADKTAEVISLEDMLKAAGVYARHCQARDLCDIPLKLLSARPFQSSYAEDKDAWFCRFELEEGEQVTSVLGGGAVVPVLQALTDAGIRNPIAVTLEYVEGGRYGGYYVLK